MYDATKYAAVILVSQCGDLHTHCGRVEAELLGLLIASVQV